MNHLSITPDISLFKTKWHFSRMSRNFSSSSFCSVWKGQMHRGNKGRFVPKRESLSLPQPLSPIRVSVLIYVGRLLSSPPLPSHKDPCADTCLRKSFIVTVSLCPSLQKNMSQDLMFKGNWERGKERDTELEAILGDFRASESELGVLL